MRKTILTILMTAFFAIGVAACDSILTWTDSVADRVVAADTDAQRVFRLGVYAAPLTAFVYNQSQEDIHLPGTQTMACTLAGYVIDADDLIQNNATTTAMRLLANGLMDVAGIAEFSAGSLTDKTDAILTKVGSLIADVATVMVMVESGKAILTEMVEAGRDPTAEDWEAILDPAQETYEACTGEE